MWSLTKKYNLILSFRIFPLKSKKGTALSIFASFLISGAELMPSAPCWEYEVRPLQQFTHISRWQHQWQRFNWMQSKTICIYLLFVFQENGFVQIHTPIITSNDCEGAGELFQVEVRVYRCVLEIKAVNPECWCFICEYQSRLWCEQKN